VFDNHCRDDGFQGLLIVVGKLFYLGELFEQLCVGDSCLGFFAEFGKDQHIERNIQ
jgi:hypothetical protein